MHIRVCCPLYVYVLILFYVLILQFCAWKFLLSYWVCVEISTFLVVDFYLGIENCSFCFDLLCFLCTFCLLLHLAFWVYFEIIHYADSAILVL